MTTLARPHIGHRVSISEDAPESPITPFRERIATRNEEHTRAFPRAATLEAQVLFRLHDEINGEATNLRGVRSAQGFRAALAGEKNFNLSDLCRLATEPTREARAAARVALSELASAIGYELVAISGSVMEAHQNVADLSVKHAAVVAKLVQHLADGVLDAHEAVDSEPALDELQRSLDSTKETVRRAKGTR